jgi:hypothetical protein
VFTARSRQGRKPDVVELAVPPGHVGAAAAADQAPAGALALIAPLGEQHGPAARRAPSARASLASTHAPEAIPRGGSLAPLGGRRGTARDAPPRSLRGRRAAAYVDRRAPEPSGGDVA